MYTYTVQFEFYSKKVTQFTTQIEFHFHEEKTDCFSNYFISSNIMYTKDVKTICEQGTINERHKKMESVLFILSYLFPIYIKNQHRNKSNKKKNLNIFRCDLSFGFSVFPIYNSKIATITGCLLSSLRSIKNNKKNVKLGI